MARRRLRQDNAADQDNQYGQIESMQCKWDDKAHVAEDAVPFGFDVHIRNKDPHQWQESVHDLAMTICSREQV